MENGTNTGKFPNSIFCILPSGDTERNFALLFWSIDLISKTRIFYLSPLQVFNSSVQF